MSIPKPKVEKIQNWYVKSKGVKKGPYPKAMIRNFVLIGRISLEDEVSGDGEHWEKLLSQQVLIPEEMISGDSKVDREKLTMAKRRQDERLGSRRKKSAYNKNDRRRTDRRADENEELIATRGNRRLIMDTYREKNNKQIVPKLIFMIFVIGLVGFFVYFFQLKNIDDSGIAYNTSNCGADPTPGVNWNNCKKEGLSASLKNLSGAQLKNTDFRGADFHGTNFAYAILDYGNLSTANLSYTDFSDASLIGVGLRNVDLTNAKLNNANLTYANLKGARLGGADLTGAKLGRAIWTDGTLCAPESVGQCKK